MRESLNEPVSVVWYYNARARRMQLHTLSWNNREYRLGKVDFWHKTWAGKHQIHHFSVADQKGQVYFKLALNTDNLQWTIEEYMTGEQMAPVYARSRS